MKRTTILCLAALFALASCTSVRIAGNGNLPPGQAKKITGEKSAKAYAPGQQKEKGNKGHD